MRTFGGFLRGGGRYAKSADLLINCSRMHVTMMVNAANCVISPLFSAVLSKIELRLSVVWLGFSFSKSPDLVDSLYLWCGSEKQSPFFPVGIAK